MFSRLKISLKTNLKSLRIFTNYKFPFSDNITYKRKPNSRISLTFEKVYEILDKIGCGPKLQDNNIRVKYCPVCPKPHHDDPTNQNTFVVSKDLVYHCFRCGEKGKFMGLLKILSRNPNFPIDCKPFYSDYSSFTENEDMNVIVRRKRKPIIDGEERKIMFNENKPEPIFNATGNSMMNNGYHNNNYIPVKTNYKLSLGNSTLIIEMSKRYSLLNSHSTDIIRNYVVNTRKLRMNILDFYKVGFSFEKFKNDDFNILELPCISFPMFYPLNNESIFSVDREKIGEEIYNKFECDKYYLSKMKVRAITKELKHFQKTEPTGALTW